MTIRAVVFDIYGTLLEVGPPPPDADARWQRLCREMLRMDPPFTRLQFSIATGQVIARHHATARARGIPHPEVHWPAVVVEVLPGLGGLSPADRDEFLLRHIQTGHSTLLNAEAATTLRWLRTHRSVLGIASNAQAYTHRELQAALGAHGLSLDLFEPLLCFWSCDHGFSKPDPHTFQILTARLAARGISPCETLMVGDRLDNDIAPAKAHGWHAWHLGTAADGDWATLRSWLTRPRPPRPPVGLAGTAQPR